MPLLTQSHDKNTAKIEFTCDNCGKKYIPNRNRIYYDKKYSNSNSNSHKFCCRKCHHEFKKNDIKFTCDNCGKIYNPTHTQRYYYKNKKAKNKFCCRKCYREFKLIYKPIELTCIKCGKNYIESNRQKVREHIKIRPIKYKFCSNECKKDYFEFLRMARQKRKDLKRKERIQNVRLTEEEQDMVDAIYKKRKYLTETTGIPYVIDHIIPVKHHGTNHPYNLQVIGRYANLIKGCSIPNLDTLAGIHEEQRKYLKSLIKPKNGKSKSN